MKTNLIIKMMNRLIIKYFISLNRLSFIGFIVLYLFLFHLFSFQKLWGGNNNHSLEQKYKLYIFFSTECPICKKSINDTKQIYEQYKEVLEIFFIFPNQFENKRKITTFKNQYQLNETPIKNFILDKKKIFTKKMNATVTPEYYLVDVNDNILYSGALNNRFYQIGVQRAEPTEFYLKDAIVSILKNNELLIKRTNPIGCFIY
jgi:thiol-disulfide isomerase/thioredoxin